MEMETTAVPMSIPGRLIGVFFSPGPVFQSLRERPSFVPPMVISIVATLLALYLITPITNQFAVDQAREKNPNMSQEQVQQLQNVMSSPMVIAIKVVGTLIGVPVIQLVYALLFRMTFQLVTGNLTTVRQSLSVVSYSNLIMLLGFCVTLPLILSAGRPDITLNLGSLVPFLDEQNIVFSLLRNIEIFTGWWMVLLGIGYGILCQVATVRAVKICLSVWVVWILLKTLAGVFFGQYIPGL